MRQKVTRRGLLKATAQAGAALALLRGGLARAQEKQEKPRPFKLAINSSTIRPVPLDEKIRVAAEAKYDGLELWFNDLDEFGRSGKPLEDMGKLIEDQGLKVPNIIGLWNCMPLEDEKREAALAGVRRNIERAQKVKAEHVAVICTPDRQDMDVLWAAERYREIMAIGDEYGVAPGVEFVSFSRGIHTLAQAAAITIQSNHPKACIVADTFHLYNGGSGFKGVRRLGGEAIGVCHFNDAPAQPEPGKLKDSDRVYPGDGILPLVEFVKDLHEIGFSGWLSLELFNAEYYKKPAPENARTGLAKMEAVIEAAAKIWKP